VRYVAELSARMKGAVFDLDETLVDRRGSLGLYARRLRSAFSDSVVLPEAEFIAEFHRLDGNGRVPRDEFFEALAAALFRRVPPRRIKEHFEATAWTEPRLFDGVADLLVALRANGWRIGIITNGGVPSQSAKIENSGLAELIDRSVISSAFGFKKPAPEIFHHMIAALGIDPRRSWFVGDDPRADMWGANCVDLRTCWVERYSAWPADLPRCYDARVDDIVDCLGALARDA
jgi:putative hydrolase of the HAD superfamily